MPVSSCAFSWSANEILRAPRCLRTTRLMSARSVASTMTAAERRLLPAPGFDHDAVGRRLGRHVIRLAECSRVGERRVDGRHSRPGHVRERGRHGRREQVGSLLGGDPRQVSLGTGHAPSVCRRRRPARRRRDTAEPGSRHTARTLTPLRRSAGELGDHRRRRDRARRPPSGAGPEREQIGAVRRRRRPSHRDREVVDLGVDGWGRGMVSPQEVGLDPTREPSGVGPCHRGALVGGVGERSDGRPGPCPPRESAAARCRPGRRRHRQPAPARHARRWRCHRRPRPARPSASARPRRGRGGRRPAPLPGRACRGVHRRRRPGRRGRRRPRATLPRPPRHR